MNTYLITGASGCIGFETLKWLQINRPTDTIIALSRGLTPYPEKITGIIQESADLLSIEEIQNIFQKYPITHLLHCAGLRTSDCEKNPSLAQKLNIDSTINLFKVAAAQTTFKEFFFLSTAAVYDQSKIRQTEVDENFPVAHYNPYVSSKLAAEYELSKLSSNYPAKITIIRPQILFGPTRAQTGSTAGTTIALQKSAAGKSYTIPFTGNYTFHFTGDVGKCIGTSLISPKNYQYEIFNLPGLSHHVDEFIEILTKLNDKSISLDSSSTIFPFAQSLSYEKFFNYFPRIHLTSLTDAIDLTYRFFREQRNEN